MIKVGDKVRLSRQYKRLICSYVNDKSLGFYSRSTYSLIITNCVDGIVNKITMYDDEYTLCSIRWPCNPGIDGDYNSKNLTVM